MHKFLTIELKEDAKETSLEFIKAEPSLFREQCKEIDILIMTAMIPGNAAPNLILKDMVDLMKLSLVIVDLASEAGCNCEYTIPNDKK